jgi:hypothetical protein
MKLLVLFTAATITAATGAALTTKLLGPDTPTIEQSATVSIEGLHGQVDLASLPEWKFDDLV